MRDSRRLDVAQANAKETRWPCWKAWRSLKTGSSLVIVSAFIFGVGFRKRRRAYLAVSPDLVDQRGPPKNSLEIAFKEGMAHSTPVK